MKKYPNRQIHMDFHTSPDIPHIGELFNSDEFGETLKTARVQLINLFGKCHHGYYYYPSKIGKQHPNLNFNLLQKQIDACRKQNIEFTVYTCVGWNEYWANAHAEWLEVSPEGVLGSKRPFEREYYRWNKLCLNNEPYRKLLKAEFKEMYEYFKPKGLWIDIILQNECVCKSCTQKMKEIGLDPQNKQDRQRMSRIAQIDFEKDIFEYLHELDANLHVYFNGYSYAMDLQDEIAISNKQKQQYNTFMDIESLPSDEWGYTHFPISVNYANKYDKEITMMNGKFHTSWGDFGSLRNKSALEYECFRALAYGAGVCVGDQLHPSGKIDKTVYARIGEVFKTIEEKEPWCLDTTKIAQIGVYGTTKSSDNITSAVDRAAEGAYRVLQELKYQFDFLDLEDSIERYALLILPDKVTLTPKAAAKIDHYVRNGGAVLVTGASGIGENDQFLLQTIGVEYVAQAAYCPRYIHIEEELFGDVPAMDYVTYKPGVCIRGKENIEILAYTVNPYFNRSEEHFCSHRHTPPRTEVSQEPAIVKYGKTIYVSSPLFTDFAENGVKAYKDLLAEMISILVEKPLVKADLPALSEVIIRENNNKDKSKIVHVLNYIIQRKCQTLDTIEDVIPLYNRKLEIRCDNRPSQVRIVPEMKTLDFIYEENYVKFVVPQLQGHTMIEIL